MTWIFSKETKKEKIENVKRITWDILLESLTQISKQTDIQLLLYRLSIDRSAMPVASTRQKEEKIFKSYNVFSCLIRWTSFATAICPMAPEYPDGLFSESLNVSPEQG